mmetsp:Transcript_16249/g.50447  ORF Transcript_16249/g.50447 Transcript_16249/m.50447 type:complete len:229 (+) Transcript_16249:219-905(+)|eukprot:CAMPEP_0119172352 /NCGR_PEP_ID=MMETSP1315-20130426/28540_1 /TAXON_ID=676789 /ORGANISM="Prasinoderma singularis, Strain RCC927" /LENGTH=228 /DNA_ID=CAMNT_0007166235 /DNA_START=211 /DNA_END=897 /DNA_ORIENTATION=+
MDRRRERETLRASRSAPPAAAASIDVAADPSLSAAPSGSQVAGSHVTSLSPSEEISLSNRLHSSSSSLSSSRALVLASSSSHESRRESASASSPSTPGSRAWSPSSLPAAAATAAAQRPPRDSARSMSASPASRSRALSVAWRHGDDRHGEPHESDELLALSRAPLRASSCSTNSNSSSLPLASAQGSSAPRGPEGGALLLRAGRRPSSSASRPNAAHSCAATDTLAE